MRLAISFESTVCDAALEVDWAKKVQKSDPVMK